MFDLFLSKFHYICIEVLAAKNRNSTKYKNIYVIIDFQRVEFTVRCNQLMFLYMSVKKSSAKGIRNTEKIYNFVIVGYFLYKSIDSGFWLFFLSDNDFKK